MEESWDNWLYNLHKSQVFRASGLISGRIRL